MGNSLDSKFAARRAYSLRGQSFTAKIKIGTVVEAVLYFDNGTVKGLSFADEGSCQRYLQQANAGQRLVAVADVSAAKSVDVDSAKEAMLREAPRKYDPRIAVAPGESVQQFSYTADQIEKVNESILEAYCERHAFHAIGYNMNVLARALDDLLQETPGAILNDTLISSTIAQLEANNMLVPRVVKRGDLAVTPYRRLAEVQMIDDQARQAEENAEALRRRSLPIEEQRALLAQDNPNFKGQGSTVNRSATQSTQTASRVSAARQISDEEKELRRQLNSGEVSFEELRAQEVQRRAEVARSKR